MQNQTKLSLFVNAAAILGFLFSGINTLQAIRINCNAFSTRQAAQKAFETDPKGYALLDKNHNGKACESRPSQATTTNPVR